MKDPIIMIVLMLMIVVMMIQISVTLLFFPERANITHYVLPLLVGCLLFYRKSKEDINK